VDEAAIHRPDPLQLVQRLAAAKAEAVAAHMQRAGERGAEPVLGCDSVLEVDGEVFGKPRDREQAIERWLRMAGGRAVLHTGHCLLPGVSSGRSEPRMAVVSTALAFAAVDRAEIEAYVESGEPLQCAGGFALEGRGGLLVERIEGCFSNVIGLSLPLLRRWLSCDPP
jgi:septum formation protein